MRLTPRLIHDSTMQSVTVQGVFGVEPWPRILQSETQELSTALLKVSITYHVMSSAIIVCTTHDIVVVCMWNTAF